MHVIDLNIAYEILEDIKKKVKIGMYNLFYLGEMSPHPLNRLR